MPGPNFLNDISNGIFERLGGLRKEQEDRDQQKKLQTLQLLTGLTDQIEPESKPLLLGHIGDVIGIKGKLRKFWDAFSGTPDTSIEEQLGTHLANVRDSLVGSETAKRTRQGANLSRLFQPINPTQEANRANNLQAEQGLQGKIIFRDPRQEKLEEIQNRYGSQLQQQLQLQEERHRDALDRQADKFRLQGTQDQVRYNQKIFLARDRLAESLFGAGKARTLDEAKTQASTYLANKSEGDLDSILATTGLKTALTDKARTEAAALRAGGGLTSAQQLAQKRFSASQDKDLRELESERAKAEAVYNDLIPKVKEMEDSLDKTAARFGKTRQDLLSSDAYSITSPIGPIGPMVKEYRVALGKKAAAESEMNIKRRQVEDFKKKYAGQASPKAIPPQKPTLRGRVTEERVGIGSTKGIVTIPTVTPQTYEVGGTLNYHGKKHKIIGIKGNFIQAIPE